MFFMSVNNLGDRDKVIRLYKSYGRLMLWEANRILGDISLAEDAVHDSFVKVIKYLDKIDDKICPRTASYLVTICRNTAIDTLKKQSRIEYAEYTDGAAGQNPDTVEIVISRELSGELKDIIKNLKPIYRDVFILRRVYGHSRTEIADICGISEETVKKRLMRAKQQIMTELERRGYNDKQ